MISTTIKKWADSVARLGPGPTCCCLGNRDWIVATYCGLSSDSNLTAVIVRYDEVIVGI